jgi:hypothetical protein
MPAPLKLILRLILLTAAISITGILISQYDIRDADNNYIAAVLEKDRLIRNTPSPKVILVGGSNLAFGIDSKMMQDSLGLSVVNMGLYAKLGLKYMLAQVDPYIKRGDVVVIVPEYDQFYGEYASGDNTLNTALLYAPNDRIPDFIRSYSIVDVVWKPRVENARRSFLRATAKVAGKENEFFPPDTNPVYNRHSFNEYGDVVSHRNRKGKDPDSIFVSHLPPMKDFNRHTLEYLNSIEDKSAKAGAHAYFMYPSYIDSSYSINVAAIDSLSKKLRGGMRIPIVGTPRDFAYPKTSFFDTRYHLTWNARGGRTRRMIELLRRAGKRDGWLPPRVANAPDLLRRGR